MNIAAVDAVNGNKGCFFEERSPHSQGYKVLLKSERDADSKNKWDFMPPYFGEKLYRHSILAKRGWVFHEAQLAPKMLCFGMREISWLCGEVKACESVPNSFQEHVPKINSICAKQQAYSGRSWRDLIESYSQCVVSCPEDKLVAISGLARLFSVRFDSQYLAGLWKADLMESLTWVAIAPVLPSHPPPYRAPSWSWASLDAKIYFPYGTRRSPVHAYHSKIVEASVSLVSDNIFGQVEAACLKIASSCILLCNSTRDTGSGTNSYHILLPNAKSQQVEKGHFMYIDDDMPHGPRTGKLTLLPIISYEVEGANKGKMNLEMLALKAAPDAESFIHTGSCYWIGCPISEFESFCRATTASDMLDKIGEPYYVNEKGNKGRLLTII